MQLKKEAAIVFQKELQKKFEAEKTALLKTLKVVREAAIFLLNFL